MLEVTGYLKRD